MSFHALHPLSDPATWGSDDPANAVATALVASLNRVDESVHDRREENPLQRTIPNPGVTIP